MPRFLNQKSLLLSFLLIVMAGAAPAQILLSGGYQVGGYTGGLRNLDTWSLELNRSARSVEQAMHWNNTFQGLAFRVCTINDSHVMYGLGFNNRHTILEARYTDAAGVAMRSAFRPRLNELNVIVGYAWLDGRVRAGASLDFGSYTFARRDAAAAEFDASPWHPFHNGDPDFLNSGRGTYTLGTTFFVELAPFSKRGAGFTLRPYYQWQALPPSMFGRYGTLDPDGYEYFLSNVGIEANWALCFD